MQIFRWSVDLLKSLLNFKRNFPLTRDGCITTWWNSDIVTMMTMALTMVTMVTMMTMVTMVTMMTMMTMITTMTMMTMMTKVKVCATTVKSFCVSYRPESRSLQMWTLTCIEEKQRTIQDQCLYKCKHWFVLKKTHLRIIITWFNIKL